jgi:N-methylhydantoinase B
MADVVRSGPSGRVTAHTVHDPFPGVPDGIPLSVTVDVDAERGRIGVDLTDNPDCQPCGLNLTEATSRAAATLGVFNSLNARVPVNAGSMRRVEVKLRENCVVGIPRFPTSCSVATTNVADRVANAVGRAFAEIADGQGLADASLIIPPSGAVISGNDPRPGGGPFVNQILLPSYGGGPGGPEADGWLTLGHAGGGGACFRDSVEIDEQRFPMRVEEQRLLADKEGAGRHRGAAATYVEYGPVGAELEVMYVSDGTIEPARGVRGGQDAITNEQWQCHEDGSTSPLPGCARRTLRPGERIAAITGGGGGYGDPASRDPELVRHDVAEGLVGRERAYEVYRVVLREDGTVDEDATAALRARQMLPGETSEPRKRD